MNKVKLLKKKYDHKRYLRLLVPGICVECGQITKGHGKRCYKCGCKFNRHESRKDITKQRLMHYYANLKLSLYDLANKFKCSPSCIWKRLKKFNIKRRNRNHATHLYNLRHKGIRAGDKHPCWKGGNKRFKCQICHKQVAFGNNFCKIHAVVGKRNPMFGKKQRISTKILISKANRGKITKNTIVKHHLDLDIENNSKSNILCLKSGEHQLFHRYAYHYLLEKYGIKEIKKYFYWFRRNHA
jgi:hypothetical protein